MFLSYFHLLVKETKKYILFCDIFLLEKGFFSVFSSHFHVLNENEGKSKKYINFLLQFIFFFSKLHKLSPFQRF